MSTGLVFGLTVYAGVLGQVGEPAAWVKKIETEAEFVRLSLGESGLPGVDRSLKFLVPVRDGDPELLPTLFQNVNLYPFHVEFLGAEFPDRFPDIAAEYSALVETRAARQYFAGVLFRFAGETVSYGFDVFTAQDPLSEFPLVNEARWIHSHLTASFTLGPIAYAPRLKRARDNAESWVNPGFPISFAFGGGFATYIPYTRAINFGRVKLLNPLEFHEENEAGAFSSQDLLVLDEAPSDIEGVIAGVITGELQGDLHHLAIRTARRGTPNAYVRDPAAAFAGWDGKLVRLEVGLTGYEIREAEGLEEAEAWWVSHRPKLREIPEVENDYASLDAVWDIAVGSAPLLTRYGGKASNFARLYSLIEEEHRVPAFMVPFHYYLRFLETNQAFSQVKPGQKVTLGEYIGEVTSDPLFQSDSRYRFRELERLRDIIEEGRVEGTVVRAVQEKVVAVFGSPAVKVRFRSSSNVEDLIEFNAAGLYDSTSGCVADDQDAGTLGPSLCDPRQPDERGIARALKEVWASLWNFRAFEEREYFQVDHARARMAVLVSEAFPDELANGIAFTGNPDVIGDRRFIINVQVGDVPSVFPDPGVLPEKDVLVMEGGQVREILRIRPSSLVEPDRRLLSDENLRELGAVMASVEGRYMEMVDITPYSREQVVLDFEFKLDKNHDLRLKQVRPFLIATTGESFPEFRLVVPEGITACGSFVERRPPREVLDYKIVMGLRAGTHVLRADGISPADVFEWIQLEPAGPRLPPVGPGIWEGTLGTNPALGQGYSFRMVQDFRNGDGLLHMVFENVFFELNGSGEIVLDAPALTWAINPHLVSVAAHFGTLDDATRIAPFLPCDLTHLPHYTVDVEFENGDSAHIDERFQDLEEGTGPAEIVAAEVTLGGETYRVEDYWQLAYTAGHHNDQPRPTHWVIFDTPIEVDGVGEVHALSLVNGELYEQAIAYYLDANFEVLAPLGVTSLLRLKEGVNLLAFRRGDVDFSGAVNITDAIIVLWHLFGGEGAAYLPLPDAADFDDGGILDLADAISILLYLYQGYDPPAEPGLTCGEDVEPDDLRPYQGPGCR